MKTIPLRVENGHRLQRFVGTFGRGTVTCAKCGKVQPLRGFSTPCKGRPVITIREVLEESKP